MITITVLMQLVTLFVTLLFAFDGSWNGLFAVGFSAGCYDKLLLIPASFGEQLKLYGLTDGDEFVEAVGTTSVYVCRSPVLSDEEGEAIGISHNEQVVDPTACAAPVLEFIGTISVNKNLNATSDASSSVRDPTLSNEEGKVASSIEEAAGKIAPSSMMT